MNEKYKEFLEIVDVPTKIHLLNIGDKKTLERYRALRTEIETALNDYEEEKKELIAEQHRLFDLAKEQEEALNIIVEKNVIIFWVKLSNSVDEYNASRSVEEYHLTPKEFGLLKKVVENYGTK